MVVYVWNSPRTTLFQAGEISQFTQMGFMGFGTFFWPLWLPEPLKICGSPEIGANVCCFVGSLRAQAV